MLLVAVLIGAARGAPPAPAGRAAPRRRGRHRPLPAVPPPRRRPDLVWAQRPGSASTRLRAEYAAYECDTMEVLRLPALSDVSVPSTARFVDAFAEAQALETDALPRTRTPPRSSPRSTGRNGPGGPPRDAAERIRLSGLSAESAAPSSG